MHCEEKNERKKKGKGEMGKKWRKFNTAKINYSKMFFLFFFSFFEIFGGNWGLLRERKNQKFMTNFCDLFWKAEEKKEKGYLFLNCNLS